MIGIRPIIQIFSYKDETDHCEKNKNKYYSQKSNGFKVVKLGHNLSGLCSVMFVYGHYESEQQKTTNQQRGSSTKNLK